MAQDNKVYRSLLKKTIKGDAESMCTLAAIAYWEYQMEDGSVDRADVSSLLEAAGAAGDGSINERIGDFFRYEFQDDKAESFYTDALVKNLEAAYGGSAQAQFALCKQYAFGLGVEQNDEKACFWCQAAARSGHQEAQRMMVNFWQDGGTLPISGEMAQRWIDQPRASSAAGDVEEIRQALLEKESVSAENAVKESRKEGDRPKKYRVTDLQYTLRARIINPLLKIIQWVAIGSAIAYVLVTAGVFLINFFTGYEKAGFANQVNHVFEMLLGIPARTFLSWFTDVPAEEMTLQMICNGFQMENPLLAPVTFVIYGAVFLVWDCIAVIPAIIVYIITFALTIEGLKVIPIKDVGKDKKDAEFVKRLNRTEIVWNSLMMRHKELRQYSAAEIMAVCDIACRMKKDIPEAVRIYKMIRDRKEKVSHPIELKKDKEAYSRMAAYFVLRNMLSEGFCRMPRMNFPQDGNFMKGYLCYRQGRDYKKAEKLLQSAIEDDASSKEEKAWAAWVLALIYSNEYQVPGGDQSRNETYIARAAQMKKGASADCIKAADTPQALAALLWSFDADTLQAVSEQFDRKSGELKRYFEAMAENELRKRHAWGDPLDKDKWQNFDTGNVWAIYKPASGAYAMIGYRFAHMEEKRGEMGAYFDERLHLTQIKAKLSGICGKGLYRADDLLEKVSAGILTASAALEQDKRESDAVRRALNAARDAAVNQQLQAFDEKWENMERRRNDWLTGHYETDWDAQNAGHMSQKEYYWWDYAHHEARERVRKEAESEYDRRRAERDDD